MVEQPNKSQLKQVSGRMSNPVGLIKASVGKLVPLFLSQVTIFCFSCPQRGEALFAQAVKQGKN